MSLQFRLNQTFNSDLSNPSSSEFKTLAAKVTSEVSIGRFHASVGRKIFLVAQIFTQKLHWDETFLTRVLLLYDKPFLGRKIVGQRSKALYLSVRGITTDPGSITGCITVV
jgi:hypothetical protein